MNDSADDDRPTPEPTINDLKCEIDRLKTLVAELMFHRISGEPIDPSIETHGSWWFTQYGWRFMRRDERRRYKRWLAPLEPHDSPWLNE